MSDHSNNIVATTGFLDKIEIKPGKVFFTGWALSFTEQPIDGLKVFIGEKEFPVISWQKNLPSAGVQKVHPEVKGSSQAAFVIEIAISQAECERLKDVLISIVPMVNNLSGEQLLNATKPCLASVMLPKANNLQTSPRLTQQKKALVEIIHVHVPKAAGTAFRQVLLQVYGPQQVLTDPVDMFKKTPPLSVSSQIKVIDGHFQAGKYEGLFPQAKVLTWLRQPIHRLMSDYCFRNIGLQKKAEYFTKAKLLEFAEGNRNLLSYCLNNYPLDHFYFIGLQEYYEQDLQELGKLLNWPKVEVIYQNRNPYPEYSRLKKDVLADQDFVQQLEALNADDMELYAQALELREKGRPTKANQDHKTQVNFATPITNLRTIIDTVGCLEQVTWQENQLLISGWVGSYHDVIQGFQVSIDGKKISEFTQELNLPSDHIAIAHPHLPNAEQARFQLSLSLLAEQTKRLSNSQLTVTPILKKGVGISWFYDLKQVLANLPTDIKTTQTPIWRRKLPNIISNIPETNFDNLQQTVNTENPVDHNLDIQPLVTRDLPGTNNQVNLLTSQEIKLQFNPAQTAKKLPENFTLLGLTDVTVEKFWQIVDPILQENSVTGDHLESSVINPIISILTPTWNSSLDWFVETVLSVLQQSISNWQWCIVDDGSANQDIKTVLKSLSEKEPRIKVKFTENGNISTATNHALAIATGEFICCLDHDDTLTPRALEISLEKLAKGFDVVYSDEDKIDFSGTNYVHPFFKPDWSPEYFRGVMYVGHLLTIKRDLILGVGGYNKEFDGVQDYELMLRVSEKTNKIGHIPQILYHWRQIGGSISGDVDAKDNIEELQQAAVNRHLQRLGLPAQAEPGVGRHRININPLPRETHPKISLIVNFGNNRVNHHEYLQKLIEQTVYPDYEILAFGRNIQIKNTVIANIPVKTIDLRGIHNHSQIYNIASDMADGEYLLCLKGGAKPLTEDWLRHLLYYAEQPDVGIVGAYSVFPNGTVQHAGIVFHETIYYAMEGFNNSDDGYAGSLVCAREVTAVSRDACMVRKDIFQELGGFNIYFYQDGQDIDFCLRLQNLGKRVIFTPRAVLVNQLAPYNNLANYNQTDYMLLLDTWQNLAETGDRYYNPNFDPGYGNYVIKQKVN